MYTPVEAEFRNVFRENSLCGDRGVFKAASSERSPPADVLLGRVPLQLLSFLLTSILRVLGIGRPYPMTFVQKNSDAMNISLSGLIPF